MAQFATCKLEVRATKLGAVLDTLESVVNLQYDRPLSAKGSFSFQMKPDELASISLGVHITAVFTGATHADHQPDLRGYIRDVDESYVPFDGHVRVSGFDELDEMDQEEEDLVEITEDEIVRALHIEEHSPEYGSNVLANAVDGNPATYDNVKLYTYENRGQGRYLLYIRSDAPFNDVYFGVYTPGAQGAVAPAYVEPFTGDNWPGQNFTVNEITNAGRSWYQSGWVSWAQNPSEQPMTHEGMYGYWARFLVHENTETFDLFDVLVKQAGPHSSPVLAILQATGMYGAWQPTAGSIGPYPNHVMAFYAETPLGMFSDMAERSHAAFRHFWAGSHNKLVWLNSPTANSIVAKDTFEDGVDDPDKTLILLDLKRNRRRVPQYTRVTAYGAGSDYWAAPDLTQCPTDIDAPFSTDGFAVDRVNNMVINTALEAELGYSIHVTKQFPHVHQLRNGTGGNPITARELALVAKAWLEEHTHAEYYTYSGTVLNFNYGDVDLGYEVQVKYNIMNRRTNTLIEAIDETMIIANLQWVPDEHRTHIHHIEFSRNLAPIPTEDYIDAQADRNDRRRAMHPQPGSKYTLYGGIDGGLLNPALAALDERTGGGFAGTTRTPLDTSPLTTLVNPGGNARGLNAVDLQSKRSADTQVASGDYATVVGGQDNTNDSDWSAIGGGLNNTITGGNKNAIAGGGGNLIEDSFNSAIGSGDVNDIGNSSQSFIGSGYGNQIDGVDRGFIGSGSGNTITGGTDNGIVSGSGVHVSGNYAQGGGRNVTVSGQLGWAFGENITNTGLNSAVFGRDPSSPKTFNVNDSFFVYGWQPYLQIANSEPADANLFAKALTWWIDQAEGELWFKVKESDGTTITKFKITADPGTPSYLTIGYIGETHNNVASNTDLVIGKHASLAADHVMVANIFVDSDTKPVSAPAGWVAIHATAEAAKGHYSFYRVATAGDAAASNFTFTIPTADGMTGVLTVYSNVDTSNVLDVAATENFGDSNTCTALGLTTVTDGCMLVALYGLDSGSADFGAISGWNLAAEEDLNSDPYGSAAQFYKTQTSAGATGNVTSIATSAHDWQAHLIALRPATA